MAKRRFIAPPRSGLDPARFAHPVFDGVSAFRPWFTAQAWPTPDDLNAAMPVAGKRFARQDQTLLGDGLHYETRIAERGAIATRAGNWHDLFNAAIWGRYPAIKRALNAQQVAHIATMGATHRNRAQYALTQFDEAGVVVRVGDPQLLACWDRHDWSTLFLANADAWRNGSIGIAAVIGHALLEHALVPEVFLVGKCLVVQGAADDAACVLRAARAIAEGAVLNDPLELRPLPLAGVPGWYPGQDDRFFAEAGCFQPVRAGRVYPPPL